MSKDLAIAMRDDPAIAQALQRDDIDRVILRAEDAYFKSTGRTRYQFVIDAIELLADRLVLMDREELGKEYLAAIADQMNRREGDDVAAQRRAARTDAARKALKSSILMLPHRFKRPAPAGASA